MTYIELLSNVSIKNTRNVIYILTNMVNGKVYIGQTTKSLSHRISSHLYSSRNINKPSSQIISLAINKYGIDNFDIKILHNDDDLVLLNDAEIYYIGKYNSTDKNIGYNILAGGRNCTRRSRPSRVETDECKLKKSKSAKKKWMDAAYRNRYIDSRKELISILKLNSKFEIVCEYKSESMASSDVLNSYRGAIGTKIKNSNLKMFFYNNYIYMFKTDYHLIKDRQLE